MQSNPSNQPQRCFFCRAKPTPDQKRLVCSKCKATTYCGQDCQLKDWKFHRSVCRDLRQPGASKNPTSSEKRSQLREFVELYKWSFEKAIYSALRVQGGMANFDYLTKVMSVELRYRAECGGNPGVAFTVEDAAFRSKEELEPNVAFVLDLSWSGFIFRDLKLQQAEKDTGYVGLMRVIYTTGDDFVCDHLEIYRHAPWFEESVAQLRHDVWLLELQRSVGQGFIFRTDSSELGARLGRMKKDKSGWSWAPLTDEEITAIGLKTSSAFGVAGEGLKVLF